MPSPAQAIVPHAENLKHGLRYAKADIIAEAIAGLVGSGSLAQRAQKMESDVLRIFLAWIPKQSSDRIDQAIAGLIRGAAMAFPSLDDFPRHAHIPHAIAYGIGTRISGWSDPSTWRFADVLSRSGCRLTIPVSAFLEAPESVKALMPGLTCHACDQTDPVIESVWRQAQPGIEPHMKQGGHRYDIMPGTISTACADWMLSVDWAPHCTPRGISTLITTARPSALRSVRVLEHAVSRIRYLTPDAHGLMTDALVDVLDTPASRTDAVQDMLVEHALYHLSSPVPGQPWNRTASHTIDERIITRSPWHRIILGTGPISASDMTVFEQWMLSQRTGTSDYAKTSSIRTRLSTRREVAMAWMDHVAHHPEWTSSSIAYNASIWESRPMVIMQAILTHRTQRTQESWSILEHAIRFSRLSRTTSPCTSDEVLSMTPGDPVCTRIMRTYKATVDDMCYAFGTTDPGIFSSGSDAKASGITCSKDHPDDPRHPSFHAMERFRSTDDRIKTMRDSHAYGRMAGSEARRDVLMAAMDVVSTTPKHRRGDDVHVMRAAGHVITGYMETSQEPWRASYEEPHARGYLRRWHATGCPDDPVIPDILHRHPDVYRGCTSADHPWIMRIPASTLAKTCPCLVRIMEDGWLADHWTELRACRAPKDPWLCLDVTGHVPEDIASSSLFDDPPSFMVKAIRARSLEADDPIRTVFKNKTSLCNLMTRGYQGSVQSCSMALGEFLQDDKRPSESVSITIMDGLLNGHRLAMAHADDIFRHRDRLHQGIVYEASQDDHRLMRYASSAHAAPHSRIPWGCWTPEQRSEVWSMMADDERIGTWTTCHLKSLIRMVHDNDTAMPIHAWLSEDPERVRMLLDRGIPPGIIVTWAMHADAPDPSVLAVIQSSDTDGSSS